jgi:sarcosine oxidase subunit gamma
MSRRGATATLIERSERDFGIALPKLPHCVSSGSVTFIWAGPAQWLALSDGDPALDARLRSSLGGLGVAVDQSDALTVIRLGGARARDVLAKGIDIDLHPGAFRPGDTAITAIGQMVVHFWQIDAEPTYELAVFRSYAMSFWEWITEAAAEFEIAER